MLTKETTPKLSNDTHLILNWFSSNSMVANTGKFQNMFLESNIDNSKITFMIENKRIKSRSEVKLVGIIIRKKLSFTTHIQNLCSTASSRLRALSFEHVKRLFEAYIKSTFRYCTLIWIFCSKAANSFINKIYKRSYMLYMKWNLQISKIC